MKRDESRKERDESREKRDESRFLRVHWKYQDFAFTGIRNLFSCFSLHTVIVSIIAVDTSFHCRQRCMCTMCVLLKFSTVHQYCFIHVYIASGENQDGILADISNVMGRTSALEEGDREIDEVSWDRSFEDDKIFMGEALLLKRTSCSVGNFAAKFLSVIFKPEELINRNCTGTRGKGPLDAAKMRIIKKFVLKLFPCTAAQQNLVWRKCVIAIGEFLRRKKRERQA